MSTGAIALIAGAFLLSAAATGLMRRYALRRELLDLPNQRSSHSLPTPRGGGVAIVAAFFCAVIGAALAGYVDPPLLTALLAGGGAIAVVGFLDDRQAMPARVRFPVHVIAAGGAVWLLGGMPERALAGWGMHGVLIGSVFAVLVLVWSTNLFNFMDGIDGIAGSEAVFMALCATWLTWNQAADASLPVGMLSLAAASLGFLAWNWPPAKIFMGDVGSGFVGFTLATLGLATSQRTSAPIEVWAILGGVFVVDATVTLLRRALRGDRWFEAHRTHAYQRLARRWGSHLPVTLAVILIDVLWLLPWAWSARTWPAHAFLCLVAALAPLVILALACGAGRREPQV